jgi:hypothetical protein
MYMSKMSLVIDLHTLFAQSLYCQGNFDRCIEVLDDLLAQSVTIEEKLPAYFIKLTILFVTNRHGECMPLTKEVFKELGFSGFPKKTNIVHVIKDLIKTKMLVSKHKDRITELPLCTDTSRKIAMGLLDILVRELLTIIIAFRRRQTGLNTLSDSTAHSPLPVLFSTFVFRIHT